MQATTVGSRSAAVATPVQFGREANALELELIRRKAPDNLRQDLSFAYDMSLQDLENFGSQSPAQMMKNGQALVGDAIQLMNTLRRQGVPEQDQPVYFVLQGQVPPIEGDRPIYTDIARELRQNVPRQAKFFLKMMGLDVDKLPNTTPPAGNYSRAEAQAALEALTQSRASRPIPEALTLMNVLLNRTRPEDLIQLEGNRFALRMVLPGKNRLA